MQQVDLDLAQQRRRFTSFRTLKSIAGAPQSPESAKAFLHDYEMLRIASIYENRDFCDISNGTISGTLH